VRKGGREGGRDRGTGGMELRRREVTVILTFVPW